MSDEEASSSDSSSSSDSDSSSPSDSNSSGSSSESSDFSSSDEDSSSDASSEDDEDDDEHERTGEDEDEDAVVSKYHKKLFDLRLYYNAGRQANSSAALKMKKGAIKWGRADGGKRDRFEKAVEDAGDNPERITRLRTALPAAERAQKASEQKKKKGTAPVNPLGSEAAYRAYKRRMEQDMPAFDYSAYRAQMSGAAPFVATSAVHQRLSDDMMKLDLYRSKQSQRRSREARRIDGDLGTTARNRQMNRWAKKAYASVLAPIRGNIERGTAL